MIYNNLNTVFFKIAKFLLYIKTFKKKNPYKVTEYIKLFHNNLKYLFQKTKISSLCQKYYKIKCPFDDIKITVRDTYRNQSNIHILDYNSN